MNRFYMPVPLAVGEEITLSETVFHHWCRVLRGKIGEQAVLFNGQGGEYTATLCHIDKKSATVQVSDFHADNRQLPIKVILGQVMSKGDRMDYAVQKATELGVSTIQLLTSERCEMRLKYDRDTKKLEHWQSIAIAACEQCGLNIVPQILPPMPLLQWLETVDAPLKLVMALDRQGYRLTAPLPDALALLVGPEGGLTEAEIQSAQQQHFQAWTIGSRVLRTETAPVAALSIINSLL